jgi:glutathione S-transferase
MMDCFGVQRNKGVDESANDQWQAQREREAREQLLAAGADQLERRPWQVGAMPPSAVDLIQFFLWRSSSTPLSEPADADQELTQAVVAALQLLPAARAEIDQLETGLLFAARGLGLTWAQMAEALGLNSPQACQQRLDRLTSRTSRTPEDLAP